MGNGMQRQREARKDSKSTSEEINTSDPNTTSASNAAVPINPSTLQSNPSNASRPATPGRPPRLGQSYASVVSSSASKDAPLPSQLNQAPASKPNAANAPGPSTPQPKSSSAGIATPAAPKQDRLLHQNKEASANDSNTTTTPSPSTPTPKPLDPNVFPTPAEAKLLPRLSKQATRRLIARKAGDASTQSHAGFLAIPSPNPRKQEAETRTTTCPHMVEYVDFIKEELPPVPCDESDCRWSRRNSRLDEYAWKCIRCGNWCCRDCKERLDLEKVWRG